MRPAVACLLVSLSYLMGSIPSGLLIVRRVAGTELRHIGSGNVGSTNVRRAAGNRSALATLICDMLKGALPVGFSLLVYGFTTTGQAIAACSAVAAILGHMFPIFLKFKPSGKGVATALGVYLVITPFACFISLIIFLIVVFLSRRVSAGSLAAITTLPLSVWLIQGSVYITGAALLTALLIAIRHRENIRRLIQGAEPKL